jgi:hypothetical protein
MIRGRLRILRLVDEGVDNLLSKVKRRAYIRKLVVRPTYRSDVFVVAVGIEDVRDPREIDVFAASSIVNLP